MGCGWNDLQGLHKMLQRKNWVADNDGGRKRKAHGEDLDESTQQEGAGEGTGSEKKCCVHGDAEQVHRCVVQSEGLLEKERLFLTCCSSCKRHVSTVCGSQVCLALN